MTTAADPSVLGIFPASPQLPARCAKGFLALVFLASGMALASRHPLWPVFILVVFYAWAVLSAWVPRLWLLVVPAAMPFLSFAPWTGWFFVDEFDLLLLATLAGAFARGALRREPRAKLAGASMLILLALLTASTLVSLAIGLAASSPNGIKLESFWEQGYTDPANAVRVFKSFGFAALFMVLLRADLQTESDKRQASRFLGLGMCFGLFVVTLVVLWERMAYPGLLEFSTRYRTTALFWEMHVGGAAIDAYLAMATPFVAWALWSAKRVRQWVLPALLALLTCYAALTTFSRGVYLATALPIILLALVALLAKSRQRRLGKVGQLGKIGQVGQQLATRLAHVVVPADWHGKAGLVLALLILGEIAVVFNAGTFMRERLERVDSDLSNRVAHWSRGVGLLETPQDWLWGRGLGRLPADYAQISDETEFSGSVKWIDHSAKADAAIAPAPSLAPTPPALPRQYLALSGPPSNPDLGGLYSLSQRIDLIEGAHYQVRMKARAPVDAELLFKVCEKHLLYEARCQSRYLKLRANTAWQLVAFPMRGRFFSGTEQVIRRYGVFSVTVLNEGGSVDIASLQAILPNQQTFLENSDFSHGMARWSTSAGSYYLPWHIDNLYLEVLIERGVIGLLLFCVMVVFCVKRLVSKGRQADALAPFLAASLLGVLVLGLVSSVLDVPRVAFMFFLLLFFAIQVTSESQICK